MPGKMYIGIDVDDQAFHGCAVTDRSEQENCFRSRPNVGDLMKKLEKIKGEHPDSEIKVCYEATYLGFSLYRDLYKRGWKCEVVAPSLIPVRPGEKVKTDKLDCRKLARYYKKEELTPVHVPSIEDEAIRDLIRTRRFLTEQLKRSKLHILSNCRRMGMSYKDTGSNNYWTKNHIDWLNRQIKQLKDLNLKMNLTLQLDQINYLSNQISLYDDQIEQISKTKSYAKQVRALTCYRGIETLTAMTLITELHDIRRFDHPRRLTSYAGMDMQEYSSGGKEIRWKMTKMGNKHIRTCVIEACQLASHIPKVSRRLRQKREGLDDKFIKIADRCMHRLYKKSNRLLRREKVHNKVKAACAREMLGFIWESLWEAA